MDVRGHQETIALLGVKDGRDKLIDVVNSGRLKVESGASSTVGGHYVGLELVGIHFSQIGRQ